MKSNPLPSFLIAVVGIGLFSCQTSETTVASEFQELNALKAVVNGESITSVEVDTAVATQIQLWLLEHKNDPGLSQAIVDAMELPVGAGQCPMLATIDRLGPLAVGDLADRGAEPA